MVNADLLISHYAVRRQIPYVSTSTISQLHALRDAEGEHENLGGKGSEPIAIRMIDA